ncbi:MAG: ribosome maturation factor RimM [Candidatus Dormibacteria bacterium]
MNAAAPQPRTLRAAIVRRPHGVHGEVRVEMLGGDSDRFGAGACVRAERSGQELVVRSARPGPDDTMLLAFEGIDSSEQAAALRGSYLTVDEADARTLGADEWFVWQLVGMRCVTPDGEDLGVVADVEPAPAADVLVIRGEITSRYPMVREFVRAVDVSAGVITVMPQPEASV